MNLQELDEEWPGNTVLVALNMVRNKILSAHYIPEDQKQLLLTIISSIESEYK